MRRHLAAFAAIAVLSAGCTSTQIANAHQTAEKAVITADYLYAAIATFANNQEASGAWTMDKGEGLKRQAYSALLTARQAYGAGMAVDLSVLTTIAQQNGIAVKQGS
jgi:hypothetical protein